jgi:cytokinin dehydrogenase
MQGLGNDDLGAFGRITFYPMQTRAFRTPLVRMPDESVAFPFNVVRIPGPIDGEKVDQLVVRNRTLYERIRKAGGVLYPVSAFPMSSEDWKQHFGSRWLQFSEARRRHDPHNVLTPGYEIFQSS